MSEPTINSGPRDWIAKHRNVLAVGSHAVIFAIALFGAFFLAYNGRGLGWWPRDLYLPLLAIALPVKLLIFWAARQYRGSWRYIGLRDVYGICWASWISSIVSVLLYYSIERLWAAGHNGEFLIDSGPTFRLRQSVFLLDLAGAVGLVSAIRMTFRLYHEAVRGVPGEGLTRMMILGAGDRGEALLREILRLPDIRYHVIGFLDRQTRIGARIHGVEVLGRPDDIRPTCLKHEVDEILVAVPTPPREMRRLVERCQGTNVRFRIVPGVTDVIEGRVRFSQVRDVNIEDLLGRDPVRLDTEAIAADLRGKAVAVTGAGGSIGSEMCRQVARFHPRCLLLIERAENNLFEIERELHRSFDDLITVPLVGDIGDAARMRWVFEACRPDVVFHAGAHKHVPMMELNPGEAVKNNIIGTKVVADACVQAGVAKMVMISTDKAVNPSSIMGCTKRVAEMYVQQLSARSQTQFITVRFGNVLGSSGSVVPIFARQIADGGPVTVTHPEMCRYFMTIPEAAQLVLQAGTMGRGDEVFVLDMGEPVKIVDLARDMITLSGLRPDEDIEIKFVGSRPGEKLVEELNITGEDVSRTSHPKIGIWQNTTENWEQVTAGMTRLARLADTGDTTEIKTVLHALVPTYREQFIPPIESTAATGRSAESDAAPSSSAPSPDPAFGV